MLRYFEPITDKRSIGKVWLSLKDLTSLYFKVRFKDQHYCWGSKHCKKVQKILIWANVDDFTWIYFVRVQLWNPYYEVGLYLNNMSLLRLYSSMVCLSVCLFLGTTGNVDMDNQRLINRISENKKKCVEGKKEKEGYEWNWS